MAKQPTIKKDYHNTLLCLFQCVILCLVCVGLGWSYVPVLSENLYLKKILMYGITQDFLYFPQNYRGS